MHLAALGLNNGSQFRYQDDSCKFAINVINLKNKNVRIWRPGIVVLMKRTPIVLQKLENGHLGPQFGSILMKISEKVNLDNFFEKQIFHPTFYISRTKEYKINR